MNFKKIVVVIISNLQMIVAMFSFYIFNLLNYKNNIKSGWVIVGAETASCLKNISSALPDSVSVNFVPNKYYSFDYTFKIYSINIMNKFYNLFYAPILFGYLMSTHHKFMYLGSMGFLKYCDGRAGEFEFLKTKNKKLICYFLGSEVRSFELLNKFGNNNNLDVITTYQAISHVGINSTEREHKRKLLAEVSDKYADIIFNPSVDQMAYIKRKTYPFIYFIDPLLFEYSQSKFNNVDELVVLHCPTSPIIKGTPLVRAAIKKLQIEGYKFKYIELINQPNKKVLESLKIAHIVLNQFYAFSPGVFAIEALATSCALLTSADETIETSLEKGANEAWKVTPYWSVYDNLKYFLDNPDEIKKQALSGHSWAKEHCTYDSGAKKINEIVNA